MKVTLPESAINTLKDILQDNQDRPQTIRVDSVIRRMTRVCLKFCEDLARIVGVGAVPGSSFFKEDVNHLIRFHFAKKDETLLAALDKLKDMKKKMPHY